MSNEHYNRMRDRAIDMARTRRRIAEHPLERLRATCEFPLRIFNVAQDMHRLLNRLDGCQPPPQIDEVLKYMESQIKEEYRNLFGTELGQ